MCLSSSRTTGRDTLLALTAGFDSFSVSQSLSVVKLVDGVQTELSRNEGNGTDNFQEVCSWTDHSNGFSDHSIFSGPIRMPLQWREGELYFDQAMEQRQHVGGQS